MAADLEGNPKKLRTRSPAYPYLDLRSALDKAATLWAAEGRHPAAVNVVMHHWGYKDESSTGYSCMAALKKFGLIELDGTGESKLVSLSNLALAILLDENPDSPARAEALRTAAMGPRIHAELWERYGSDLPSDQSLKRYLVLEKSFNEAAVNELLEEYKQTVTFAGLTLVPAPTVAAGAFAPVTAPPSGAAQVYPPTGAAGAPVSPGRYGPTGAELEPQPPYERRQEAAAATFQPPPRAIGPAGGTRREAEPFQAPQRGPGAREEGFASPAPSPNGGNGRRRDAGGYALEGRPPLPLERETTRYDQDDFGYEEDESSAQRRGHPALPPAGRVDGRTRPGAGPGGTFASNAGAAVAEPAGSVEVETINGVSRKELPVPLDGDRVALVPYPMTEEDFSLLIATLQLWKKRLVR